MLGQKFGHYEITAKLGQGGMGEVYRARDTRLDRDVALKFLPPALGQDETARLRFIREAKAAAAIDHPYICSIYEVGQTDAGADYIAMEYVAGQTLQEKLEEGPLPLEKALNLLIETAEALEKAHKAGFLHRDLKPANLMLPPEDHVKVMDFGLAKRIIHRDSQEQEEGTDLTRQGSTVGTLAYMSPEQLRGEELDTRSDLFSYGVVLYATLTGVNPFRRKQAIETASAILNDPAPPLGKYLGEVPYRLEWIVSKLLSKDRERRYQLIHEVRTDLEALKKEWESGTTLVAGVPVAGKGTPLGRRLPWALAGFFCLACLTLLWLLWPTPAPPRAPRRLSVDLGTEVTIVPDPDAGEVLSPDGSVLAFRGERNGQGVALYLRRLDQPEPTLLPGTRNALQPCFSPDGRWIVFQADHKLKKVALNGGAVATLCEADDPHGIWWGDNDSIVFAPEPLGGLFRVSAAGGEPEPLTTLAAEEVTHRWPQMLPGGDTLIFTAHKRRFDFDDAQIVAQRLGPDGERKVLWKGGYQGRYLPTGHLIYIQRGTLFAVALDLETLETRGRPAPVLEGVWSSTLRGSAHFAFSENGTLAYLPGNFREEESQLEWLGGEAERRAFPLQPANIGDFRLSPTGRSLALNLNDGRQWDIWIYDIERQTLTRLTFDPADDLSPVWSPSGETIIFGSERDGLSNLYLKRADGSGHVQRLTESQSSQLPSSWHPTGRYVAFREAPSSPSEAGVDRSPNEVAGGLYLLAMEGDDQSGWTAGETTTLLDLSYRERDPVFSPDGRWLAYASFQSTLPEVYVRPFPGPGGKWQISNGGGVWPQWSNRSQGLLFAGFASGQMYQASYRIEGNSFVADRPERWEEADFHQRPANLSYNLHPDGQGLLLRKRPDEASRPDLDRVMLFENLFDYLGGQVLVP